MKFSSAVLVTLAATGLVHAADFAVTVGGPGVLQYTPNQVVAQPGDTVTFTFEQSNHTLTQSTLQNPCQEAANGVDSGFLPVASGETGPFPQAQFTVKDTNPLWFFCRQANHCQQGMVFAINPGTNFAAFQAAATGGSAISSSPNPAATTTAVTNAVASPTTSGFITVTATVTVPNGQVMTTTYGSYPGSAAPTTVGSTTHQITVGGTGKLFYDPSNITAQVGDVVTFNFMQVNHTITQSSFAAPCRALALTSTSGQVGFDSGFMPVTSEATTFPSFSITVNDTAPIWAYCRQANHCGQGMVFSVNALESGANNFAAFQAAAKLQNGTSATASSSAVASSQTSNTSFSGAGANRVNWIIARVVGVVSVIFGVVLL